MQDAIDNANKNGTRTVITMLKDVNEQVTTYEGQNILLELEGNNITSEGITITNNGTLEIHNSQETGGIETTANIVE